ncbi:MAG: DUF3343 domain-containing protein [Deltaproteobacteria bacterium]|jgi:hypothetical protein|nr:DUF3343 domain-containing protein [Deltaproteobacteria bacterium]
MEIVFTFHSTHDAINGERLLLSGGVKVKVMALPSSLGAGCGLCLRVAKDELDRSRGLLSEVDIHPQAVYAKNLENGKAVYTALEISDLPSK